MRFSHEIILITGNCESCLGAPEGSGCQRGIQKKAHHTAWSHLTPHSHILRVATHRYHIQLEASGSLPYELYPESRGNKK